MKFFGPVKEKKFRQNYDASPLLCIQTFDARFFLKRRRVPLRNFLAPWHKKLLTKSWYPYYPIKTKNFGGLTFGKNKGLLRNSFGAVRQGIFARKWRQAHLPIKIFWCENFCEKQEDSVTMFSISLLWDKTFLGTNRMPPFPMRDKFFWQKVGFPYGFFRQCETKNVSAENSGIPSYAKKFWIPEFLWNIDVFLDENFQHCEIKIFRQKNRIPHLLSIIFGPIYNLLETQNWHLTRFSVLWSKKTFRQNCFAPLNMHGNFWYQIFFWNKGGIPCEVLNWHCETKKMEQKIPISPSYV